MSSSSDILRLDPALRIAMSIGKQAGIPRGEIFDMYSAVVLGELAVGEFFIRVREKIKDPALLATLDALIHNLPEVGARSLYVDI